MIKPQTLSFLKDIALNNNREWFAEHKDLYEEAKTNALEFVAHFIKIVSAIDPYIPSDTDPKKCLMRIYRDVRFSKNKDPYKKNFGIWISAKGKNGNQPGYYMHIEPGHSFLAGGYWMPEADHLKLIRQEIDYNADDFLAIVEGKEFAKTFKLSKENALKNAPKGYEPTDPNIEYLKLKSFEVIQKIVDKLKSSYQTIYPLVAFLRNALNQS
jgi:uncharacterized protein (TIGR02453 family)